MSLIAVKVRIQFYFLKCLLKNKVRTSICCFYYFSLLVTSNEFKMRKSYFSDFSAL